jgi:hypothetical protein
LKISEPTFFPLFSTGYQLHFFLMAPKTAAAAGIQYTDFLEGVQTLKLDRGTV